MIDWHKSMQQTFEYYIVDPATWADARRLEKVKSCNISRDLSSDTLGYATFELDDYIDEQYIRVYLSCTQNGVTERFVLGTFLVQTLPDSFDGKVTTISADAYTPLIELTEDKPPLGYTVMKGSNIMEVVCNLTREHCRAPVVRTVSDKTLFTNYTAGTDDSWLKFIQNLMSNADYQFALANDGTIMFIPTPKQNAVSPRYVFTDDNSSIMYPDITKKYDLYKVPNTVEIIYSKSNGFYRSVAVNEDPSSPVSLNARGRTILYREMNPSALGSATQAQIDEYAQTMLRSKSTLEETVTFKHGYVVIDGNDLRLADGVMLSYTKAKLDNQRAVIINQTIDCSPGCPVTETVKYNKVLWRAQNG